MKYLMFVCTEPATSEHAPSEADRAGAPDVEQWWKQASDRGQWLMGDRLRPSSDATTVRVRGGELLLTDGPFAEAKEVIVGFDVLECADLDEAIEVAAGHPLAHAGALELRPIWPLDIALNGDE